MFKEQHLFVIGNPRSGTSLLRIILNSHKNMVVPPECGFIQWWYDKYKNWPQSFHLAQFVEDLKSSKKIETWDLDFDKLYSFLKDCQPKTYAELTFSVIKFYGIHKIDKKDLKVLGDKNNYYINHLKTLKQISIKSKFILIYRDPKDIYCSYKNVNKLITASKFKPNVSNTVDSFINEWTFNQNQIFSFFSNLKSNNFFVISYEDLVVDTHNQLLKICNFLNLEFDSQMLSYYKNNDEPVDLLDWKKKTLTPPDQSSIGRYTNELSLIEIDKIDSKTKMLVDKISELN